MGSEMCIRDSNSIPSAGISPRTRRTCPQQRKMNPAGGPRSGRSKQGQRSPGPPHRPSQPGSPWSGSSANLRGSSGNTFKTPNPTPQTSGQQMSHPQTAYRSQQGPDRTAGGAPMVMHDTASAIQGRQQRNQRPRLIAAGDESPHSTRTSASDNDDPDVSFPHFPRVTRQQARQLNLQVSSEGCLLYTSPSPRDS